MLMDTPVRILLVEDDDLDRSIVRRALRNSGLSYELQEAFDGATAVEAFEKSHFDCIILDYHLPDQDGADVFRTISLTHGAAAAVIFLTGEDNEELALTVMESGAVDYLNKNELAPAMLRRAIRYARARQHFLSELSDIGRRDALTGLPNRAVFEGTLTSAVAQCTRTSTMVAALLLDLDHFKDVNDTMGHPAGDVLLQTVAQRLEHSTRETDIVIRLGGDEFLIVAPNLNNADGAIHIADKILDSMSRPTVINDHELHISTSIGIAMAPHDGHTPSKILKSADLALYKAKGEGRDRYCFYDESMDIAAHNRRQMELDLRHALERREFELYYQPKVEADSGAMIGVEALLRWHHPERGLVSPGDFIPLAETNRLILPIGEWVLHTAAKQIFSWNKDGIPLSNCSINLSPVQLADSHLVGALDKVIKDTGVDPSCLEIEITESALMNRIDSIAECLNELRSRGIAVSVDDFGTGYSSLVHLKQLPLDKLKIDRSFISNMVANGDDAEITHTIISLGKSIGLDVIAEGVETAAQRTMLQDFGCSQIQGYFFCRPLPPDQFAVWYHRHNSLPTAILQETAIT